jgi:hypothetical protein
MNDQPMIALHYGDNVYLQNGYSGWEGAYLDTNGRDNASGSILHVTTAGSPTRDGLSGTWKIISTDPQRDGTEVRFGDAVHLQNLYSASEGYLDTNNRYLDSLFKVSTTANPNRDGGSGTWTILSTSGKLTGMPVQVSDPIYLQNGYSGAGYLDTNNREDGRLRVTTAGSPIRDGLSGTWQFLLAPGSSDKVWVVVHLPVLDINIYKEINGEAILLLGLNANASGGILVPIDRLANPGETVILRQSVTGGKIGTAVVQTSSAPNGAKYSLFFEPENLCDPNEIEGPPDPTPDMLLPRNSDATTVGFGKVPVASTQQAIYGTSLNVVHEQYWRRSSQSYTIASGEQKTVITRQTTGVTMSSEKASELSAMVSGTASAELGTFSASLSASLNYSSSHSEMQTLSSERVTTMEGCVKNMDPEKEVSIFIWELVDLYHLYNAKKHIVLESVQAPAIIKVYPSTVVFGPCSEQERPP